MTLPEKMSLAFSFAHKSSEKVSYKNQCKKIPWKPPAWISSKGEEQEWRELLRQRTLTDGQQHHHLLEGAALVNVPVATKGGVRNAFGRYAT